jgi:phenylacetate-CoA ligase
VDLIAPLTRHVVAPLWAKWEGSPYLRHYRRMLRTQYDPPAVIQARQVDTLRSLAKHAAATVPFWRDRFAKAGLQPCEISQPEDLRALPLLTKADLREQGERLLSPAYAKDNLHRHATSGSTGVSVVTYRDEACQQFKRGATLRSDEWSGWRLGERAACVWGNPEVRTDWKGRLRNALLERQYLHLDTLKMTDADIDRFVVALERSPPSLLFGHAHSLYLVAKYIENHSPTAKIRPRGIISTCMVLHEFERAKIEQVFDCPVTNRYGCEEVSLIASQCEQHTGLHVNADCIYLEIIDEQGAPCPPGQPGRIIVTDLTNRAMPIFRYEVGDMASWSADGCPCGRTLPLLEKLEGRVADYVVTRQGEYISGISLTENFAQQIPGLAQLQIIQEDIDHFVYNVVRGPGFDDRSMSRIAELTDKRFGPTAQYECCFVDKIPQEPSGKYRFCISKIAYPVA